MKRTNPLLIILLIISLLLNAYLITTRINPDLDFIQKLLSGLKKESFVGTWESGLNQIIIREDGVVYTTISSADPNVKGYEYLAKGKIVDNVIVYEKVFNENTYYTKNGKYFKKDIPLYSIQDECYDAIVPTNLTIEKTSDNVLTIGVLSYVRVD